MGNEAEESELKTIEYLRVRLLSERSVSKAAKERAEELGKRVKELEEQVKVVSFQRKRAEKTALDVVSYLHGLGFNDISDAYESDSNEEEECECLEIKGNGEEKDSSTPSLSWKGRKESSRLLLNSSIGFRSRTTLALLNSSPRHRRLGKSCRQIKTRDLRSTIEQSKHDSTKSDADECLNHCQDCLDFRSQELMKSPQRSGERGSRMNEAAHSFQAQTQECDSGSATYERECSGEMERALQHQAQLIRCHEAQEKAQRDWEEKYGENNDSYEPGSHSDVTEERDENKAASPLPVEVDACDGLDHNQTIGAETNSQDRKPSLSQLNSFKISHDADIGSSDKHNFSDMQPSTSSSDFAFLVANNNQFSEHAVRHHLFASHVDPSPCGSTTSESQPPQMSGTFALVPQGEPAKPESVLDALQEAKLLIQQHMNSLPKTGISVERASNSSGPENRDLDWLKLPVRCPGLFRVPTDLEGQSSIQNKLLGSDYPSELTNSTPNTRAMAVQRHQYISSPIGSRLGLPSGDPFTTLVLASENISNWQPRFDFHYNTSVSDSRSASLLQHSSFPNDFEGTSSNQTVYSQFPRSEAGIPPSGYPFHNYEGRPNTYK